MPRKTRPLAFRAVRHSRFLAVRSLAVRRFLVYS
jgi:hypothetical protein